MCERCQQPGASLMAHLIDMWLCFACITDLALDALTAERQREREGDVREYGAASPVAGEQGLREEPVKCFTATVFQGEDWFVAQALEVDVASQGKSVEEALANLREALTLYFEPPYPGLPPRTRPALYEVEVPIPSREE